MAYTTINKPKEHFNTVTYTGNTSAGHAITGVGFQPDLTWNKSRANATPHYLFDVIRGATNFIKSDSTSAESQNTDTLTSFDSDGFTLGNATGNNGSGSFASWNWKANGTGVANTDGSISSTVSASATSGFSIVSYTATGSTATIGHGLGAIPKMMIIKNTTSNSTWAVYHASLGTGKFLRLQGTDAVGTEANWFDTTPTSSVFTVGSNLPSGATIAYCFADVQGYSKVGGSYTGNGNADGTFVYTGFKPSFVMIKKTDSAGNFWHIYDNKRSSSGGSNVINDVLYPNRSDAEYSEDRIDFVSNGIKFRSGNGDINSSGGNYIYMAFASAPLVGTNNVPCTAR